MLSSRKQVCSLAMVIVAVSLMFYLVGCAGSQGESEPDYADDEVMSVLSDALQRRFDYSDSHANDISAKVRMAACQIEIDALEPFKNRMFEDSKLQEKVLAYVNLLDECVDATTDYPETSFEFIDRWNELYDERTSMLKDFVDSYGLRVDSAHQDTFDDLLLNGKAVQSRNEAQKVVDNMLNGLLFEKTDDGYGNATYSCTAENTSGYDLSNITLTLGLYDADNVKITETYASTTSWSAGEKIRLEAFDTSDATTVKIIDLQYQVEE